MGAHIGAMSFVAMAAEATWGTPNTTYLNFLRVVSLNANRVIERTARQHLLDQGAGSFVQEESFDARDRVRSNLVTLMSYDDSNLTLLAHAMHLDPVTTGAGPFVHTFDIGKPYDHGGTGAVTGLTLGLAMGDNAEQENVEGNKCSGFSLSIEAGGEMQFTTDWIGETSAARTTLSMPTFSSNGQGVRHTHAGSLSFNSLTFDCIRNFEVSVDHRIGERDCLGSTLTAEPMPTGMQEVRGRIALDSPNSGPLKGQLYDAYLAATQTDLAVTFTGSGNNVLTATVHDAKIFSYTEAVNSMGVTEISCEFQGHAVVNSGLTIVITNDNTLHTAN
ncbi:hypothetical protein LCGC14_0436720 [marine sediment metagenome]|uniref:Uncharacterized protein n=1 Tax=marine sediment metagenome TaxID=412755 RepID=A0A0F9VVV8_9ZZZZ